MGQPPVLGTFTFVSSVPVAAIALRTFVNQRDDFLITTLPLASLSPEAADTIYFPQYVDGGGATTEVVLVNPTNATISGSVQFGEKALANLPPSRSASPWTMVQPDRSSVTRYLPAVRHG